MLSEGKIVNQNLERYALDLAEDYVAFLAMNDGEEFVLRPEAYAKARVNNMLSQLTTAMMENLKEMGVE